MATSFKWLYPPNFNGYYGGDKNGHRRVVIQFTNIFGANETDIVKVNRSELRCTNGLVPSKLVVEKITASVTGYNLKIEWDTNPQEMIAVVDGGTTASHGARFADYNRDYTNVGGMSPSEEGGTGDIIITSGIGATNDSYDVILTIRLKE